MPRPAEFNDMNAFRSFAKDIGRLRQDPYYRNPLILVSDTAFWVIFFYRFFSLGQGKVWHPLLRFPWEKIVEFVFGVYLPSTARIGPGLVIYHAFGIIVNGRSVLGENVTLYARVCIGSRFPGDTPPRLGNGVVVGTGACVLGPVVIPDGMVIPANAVVTPRTLGQFRQPASSQKDGPVPNG